MKESYTVTPPVRASAVQPGMLTMIMQRLDHDDDMMDPLPTPSDLIFAMTAAPAVPPGLMYRGVPQDHQRQALRIDAIHKHVSSLKGPAWIVSGRQHRECNLSELFFG